MEGQILFLYAGVLRVKLERLGNVQTVGSQDNCAKNHIGIVVLVKLIQTIFVFFDLLWCFTSLFIGAKLLEVHQELGVVFNQGFSEGIGILELMYIELVFNLRIFVVWVVVVVHHIWEEVK